jgi:LysM repeat protein
MNQEPTYHIDVTPEEDALFRDNTKTKNLEKFVPNSFKKVFCVVLGVHLLVGAAVAMSSKVSANNPPVNFTDPVPEVPVAKATSVATPQSVTKPIVESETTPTPKLQATAVANTTKLNEIQNKPIVKQPAGQHTNEKFVKEYTIKQGDTITNIAKKYKLNTERLIKLNNIKDVNKIQVGQKLKFM